MKTEEWTTGDWIIRGLVASCISEHTLFRWYREHADRPVRDSLFHAELHLAYESGVVYVQRRVPCYEHESYLTHAPMESGFALTEMGEALDPTMRDSDDG